MPFLDKLHVSEHGARLWRLTKDLEYEASWQTFTVPAGYVTDFATIPRLFRGYLFDSDGPWMKGAVVHDYLLTDTDILNRDKDGIFRKIMLDEGVSPPAAWTLWAAVRVGALANPKRAKGRGFVRDLPAVALIGVVAAPLLLPAVLGISITLALIWPFRVFRRNT